MKKTTVVIALLAMMVVPTSAQKGGASEEQLIKNANELFETGQYLKAYPMYSQLVSLYPQHAEYNYKFGACAIYSDPDKTKAIRYLTSATNKGVQDPMAWYYLGKAYHLNYEFKPAIKAYEDFLSKADPKVADKTNARRDIETCVYGSGLLSNIKDVVVLNKTEADRENFFRYFNLEEIGGRILSVPDELKSKLDEKSKEPGVMYYPGNGTTIYFSSYGKDGSTGKDIYKAQILPDGKFSAPEKVSGGVNTRYDEDFCFMHSDGKTLYFSSKGHNSMGGYDIFKCDMDASGNFGPAVNLDFAVNTPDDDIFYCVDSKNEKAYFASARTSDQGHLHVYNVMVQGIPLNIIYIKGEFINEINPDQKTAGLTIKGIMGGSAVSENKSDPYTGKYVVYAPKGGQYKLEVATTNSPIVHNTLMNVPSFDKPVAVRQEIRLVKENGVEKLIVNNYFEEVLNEDIAALAADMLRKKARLDVNATDEMVKAAVTAETSEPEIAVEKTMDNAVLAAGFQEGITVPAVVSMMDADIRKMDEFVSTADQKSAAALHHAMKKYQEAETLLARAESLRKNTDPSKGEAYLESMRESHRLSLEAENLRREASSAIASAEAMTNFRGSENQRKEDLRTRMNALSVAEKSNDFNTALAELKLEKDRQTALRGGQANPTLDEMNAKVRAKEGEEKASLEKLDRLRNDEKSLNTDIRIAEERMNSAKKKADKESAEMEFATLKGKLDAKRKEILNETIRAERLGKESADMRGQASFYASLLDGSHQLDMNQTAAVSESEKNTVRAKLREMDSRLDALEITDPQMLALLGDMKEEQPLASSQPAPASDMNIGRMREARDARLSQYSGNDYAMVAGRRMVLSNEIDETNSAIASYESKGESRLTDGEKAELTSLRNYRTELKAELAGQVSPQPAVSGFDVNAVYAEATPGYQEMVNATATASENDVQRNIKSREVKLSTLNSVKELRRENAEKAMANTDSSKAAEFAMKDAQYALAIEGLSKDLDDATSIRTAFESENKDIIESDLVYADKLNAQIELTRDYSMGLQSEEKALRSRLNAENDPEQRLKIEQAIASVSAEKQQADNRIAGYQKDLDLTLAASGPSGASATPVNTNPVTPTETAENKTEATWNFNAPTIKGDDEESQSQAEKDSEAMIQIFKPVKEEESIYAYETGILDELSYKYATDSTEIRNRDKIVEISDNIFLIEAEIENEKNPLKQRKLDRDAEKLYLKKALLEIGNAESIKRMTNAEFDVLLEEVKKLNAENKAKIDSRVMLKDEVKSLFNKAKDEMEDAAILRKRAYPVVDDIEKNDYFRRAFAKEVYAMNLLKQVKSIHENLDMMLQYDDQQLAALRYGKLEMFNKPAESELAQNTSVDATNTAAGAATKAAEVNSNTAPVNAGGVAVDSKRVTSSGTSTVVSTTTGQASSAETSTSVPNTTAQNRSAAATGANTTSTNTNAVASNSTPENRSANASTTVTTASSPVTATSVKRTEAISETQVNTKSVSAGEMAQTMVNSGAVQNVSRDELMSSPEFLDYTALMEEASMLDGKRMNMIRERNQLAAENNEIADQVAALEVARANATTQEERDALQKQIDKLAADHARNLDLIRVKDLEIESLAGKIRDINAKADARYASISGGNITVFTAGTAENTSVANTRSAAAGTSLSVSSGSSAGSSAGSSESRAAGGAYSRAEAESMLFNFPDVLEKELFLITNKSVYSESKPIPVDVEMPKGVYYRVQVGAFRNRIPQDLYDQFAPVSGESLNNGITRYSAGFFLDFDQANKVKSSIRGIGYGDAFVVAYRDGKRIPLYEAMALTQGDFQASVENEYVFGDNGANKSASASTPASGSMVVKSASYYDYNKYPNAARANQVEVMAGLFYTVQVGVYSKPVAASSVYNISPLNSELTANKMVRYSSGVYTDMESAIVKRDEARRLGIGDAFITAYYNGNRITLTEADKLIRENGEGIFLRK